MVRVQYGSDILDLDIPPKNLAFNLRPVKMQSSVDEHFEIQRSLMEPIGCGRLRDIVPHDASVVILGDDRTRMTPQSRIIPVVLEELHAAGIHNDRIKILIAYGTHRAMTSDEVADKYGRDVVADIEVLHHDCLRHDNLTDMGVTRRGTRIFVNREYMEADFRIGIGSVIPHYPTGWSGGAKILLPGAAGQATTYAMHLLGVSEQALGQETSPVREEMEDFAQEVGLHFIVNVIHDERGTIIKSFAGHFVRAHREAVRFGMEVFGAPFREKAEITLSSTYPIDFDLTQCSKGFFSAELATKPGGEIILLSPCIEGIAPTHGEEMARLARFDSDTLVSMIQNGQVDDPLSATECMYYNIIKKNFRTTITMDPETSTVLGFHHLSPEDISTYIERRLIRDDTLKIGVINQSTDVLPIKTS